MRRPPQFLTLATVVAAAVALPAAAAAATAIDPTDAPTGTHLANGSAQPACTVGEDVGEDGLTVTCNSYTLQGVGHTNATLNLSATYTETVQCTNHGNKVVVA
jgi:hypothetical protein